MSRSSRDGVTRVEVLVVVAILVVLAGLFLPATRRVREAAGRATCLNHLKQLMSAMHSFASATGPAATPGQSDAAAGQSFPTGCRGPGTTPDERLSWMVTLLPYLEQNPLAGQFDLTRGYADNLAAARTPIKPFLCPDGKASAGSPVTHYVAMAGVGLDAATRPAGAAGIGLMGYDRLTPYALPDGNANTIALMETRAGLGPWARGGESNVRGFDPADLPLFGAGRPFGGHPGGPLIAMGDGSAHGISLSVDPKVLAAAITIAGGEPFGLE